MIRVNLIPQAAVVAQVRRRHLVRWSAATAVALVLVSVPLGLDWMHRARAQELEQYSHSLQTELGQVRAQWRTLSKEAKHLQQRLSRAGVLRSKRSWSKMLALVASCTPAESWLTSIATDPATPVARKSIRTSSGTGRKENNAKEPIEDVVLDAPRKLVLEGYAVDAILPNVFVTNLKDTGVFTRVTLEHSTMESVHNGTYLRFLIACEW